MSRVTDSWADDTAKYAKDNEKRDLAADLLDSRAECERLRLECDDLAQERDGIKHSRVCRNNVAAGNSPDHPHLSDCLRCETDRLRAKLAEAVEALKPFAALAPDETNTETDDVGCVAKWAFPAEPIQFTVGDLRRAARVVDGAK